MNLWEFLLGLFHMWKPLTAVTAMHFFHHFAIWMTNYSYEEIMQVVVMLSDDVLLREYFPYSITWLINDAWSDAITWFSWVGYRFREEAQLWWLVDRFDRQFESGYLKYRWAEENPSDRVIQEEFENFLTSLAKKPHTRSLIGDVFKKYDRKSDIFREKELTGLEGFQTDEETEPERPQQEPRIRFHNQERSYPQGKPHYYYANPHAYYAEEVGNNFKESLQEKFDEMMSVEKDRLEKIKIQNEIERQKKESEKIMLERQKQGRKQYRDGYNFETDDSDLSDHPEVLNHNTKQRKQQIEAINPFDQLGSGTSKKSSRGGGKNSEAEERRQKRINSRLDRIQAAYNDEDIDDHGLTRIQRMNKHQAKVRADFDSDDRTYAENEPRKSLWRDQKQFDTADFLWNNDEDPLDYL